MIDPDKLEFRRLRPLRATEGLRRQNAETSLSADDFIYPMFVTGGERVRRPIEPMPGQFQLSVDMAVEQAATALDAGVHRVLLFGLPDEKDATGTRAWHPDEAIQRAISAIKSQIPGMTVVTDVCLCEYTDHGHCGVVKGQGADATVDNDATLPLLAREAVSHAEAGADIVAPSAMMDGQVAALRAGLDEAGFRDTPVMGYSAKYASSFYGPFRVAADSSPQYGDRLSYQMSPTQCEEAMREIEADVEEGADFIMVKPALAYLDVIHEASRRFTQPLAAYNVSGEYAMIKAAGANGWLDEDRAAMEALIAIKRAGADLIITYFAIDAAGWLAENS